MILLGGLGFFFVDWWDGCRCEVVVTGRRVFVVDGVGVRDWG